MQRRFYLNPIFFFGLSLAANTAYAAKYSFIPFVTVSAEYDSNVALDATEETTLSGGAFFSGFSFAVDDQENYLALNLDGRFNYFNLSRYDLDSQSLGLEYEHRFERGVWEASINGLRTSTRTSELDEGGSGIVESKATRVDRVSTNIKSTYRVSERNQLAVGAEYASTEYESDSLRGVELFKFDAFLLHELTQRFVTQFGVQYDFFDYEQNDRNPLAREESLVSPRIGFQFEFAENTSADLYVGQSYITTKQELGVIKISEEIEREVYGVGFLHERELLWLNFTASSEERASSSGSLIQLSSLKFALSRKLTEYHRVSGETNFYKQEAISETRGSSLDREYTDIKISYRHDFLEDWSYRLSLRHRSQESGVSDVVANQEVASFSIMWQPTRASWSR